MSHKLTGKEFDTDGAHIISEGDTPHGMELNYFGARYYDSVIGMWISLDAMEQHISGYTYGSNNPINRIDSDGNLDWGLAGASGLAMFGSG